VSLDRWIVAGHSRTDEDVLEVRLSQPPFFPT